MKLYINCVTNYMFLEIYISAPIFFIFVQGNYDRGREILLIIYLFIICLFNMEHNNYYMYNKQFFCLSIFFLHFIQFMILIRSLIFVFLFFPILLPCVLKIYLFPSFALFLLSALIPLLSASYVISRFKSKTLRKSSRRI